MKDSLVNKLCCPFDKEDLQLKIFAQDTNGNISEGLLTCNYCKRYYPIVYGVPIMSPDEYRERMLEIPVLEKWENKLQGNHLEGFTMLPGTNGTSGLDDVGLGL